MMQGRYHPVMQAKMSGGLDASGNLVGLHMRLSGQSILAAVFPQKPPGRPGQRHVPGSGSERRFFARLHRAQSLDRPCDAQHARPARFWRGVNINQNAIFLECFMDELALAAGQDALEFRRKLMSKHPKHLAVLKRGGDRAGWGKPAPQGVHRGLAHMMAFGSYVAACAEVVRLRWRQGKGAPHRLRDRSRLRRQPGADRAQIAGSFVYGLSAWFMEECTVKNGAIEQTNFTTYDSMKIAQMPKVESIIMPSGGFWGGVGERRSAWRRRRS